MIFDTSFFDGPFPLGTTPREYELFKFEKVSIDALAAPVSSTKNIYKQRLLNFFRKETYWRVSGLSGADISNIPVSVNMFFSGYWQSFCYIEDVLLLLKNDFKVNDRGFSHEYQSVKDSISSEGCSVAVHVRRGDYVACESAAATFHLCGLDSYQKAMSFIKSKDKDAKFYIFSDDISWCQNNFDMDECYFVRNTQSNLEDFELMRRCHHSIIANSSFSWWTAILKDEEEASLVVVPKDWLKSGESKRNMHPSYWIEM